MERLYFRAVVAGDPAIVEQVGSQASAWQVDPGLPAETACRAGHLDAVRELIDGQQWLLNT